MYTYRFSKHLFLAVSLLWCLSLPSLAQDLTPTATPASTLAPEPTAVPGDVTNTFEGVSGYLDAKHRNPIVTVTVRRAPESNSASLLVDAYVPDGEFSEFPLRFDFYINRHFFASQIRSAELPGPVGADIGPDVATIPFNYSVVVTVLHPNKLFTTVFNGAVENTVPTPTPAAGSGSKLDCTLTTGSADPNSTETDRVYTARDINASQPSSEAVSLQFTATDASGSDQATVVAAINFDEEDGNAAQGSITLTTGGSQQTIPVTGAVTTSDGSVTGLSLDSEDLTTSLECSAAGSQ